MYVYVYVRQAGEAGLPGGRPRRILVEGEPGFGKSTLTLKLLHDWACDDAPQYLRYFQVSDQRARLAG